MSTEQKLNNNNFNSWYLLDKKPEAPEAILLSIKLDISMTAMFDLLYSVDIMIAVTGAPTTPVHTKKFAFQWEWTKDR